MVLESQRVRSSAHRSYVGSRRRRRKWRYLAAMVIVCGGIYLGFEMFGGNGKPATNGPAGQSAVHPADHGQPGAPGPSNTTAGPAPTDQASHPLLGGLDPSTGQSATSSPPGSSTSSVPPSTADPSVTNVAASTAPPAVTASAIRQQIEHGRQLIQTNKLVEARQSLNAALNGPISDADARAVRGDLAKINEQLIFSSRYYSNDPLVKRFTTTAQKYQLSKIAPDYDVPWELIQRINRIDPRRIRVGQLLKIPQGPFHLVIIKHAFRADLYLQGSQGPVYIRSFPVGLGEGDSTPVGNFQVRQNSKLKNPRWANPRTGKVYDANDPTNPIGERWIGLAGTDEQTRVMSGYGLHGTIEPQSIGKQASMGCIRFLPHDIELVYDLLIPVKSKVTIRP